MPDAENSIPALPALLTSSTKMQTQINPLPSIPDTLTPPCCEPSTDATDVPGNPEANDVKFKSLLIEDAVVPAVIPRNATCKGWTMQMGMRSSGQTGKPPLEGVVESYDAETKLFLVQLAKGKAIRSSV